MERTQTYKLSVSVLVASYVTISMLHCWSAIAPFKDFDKVVRPLIQYSGMWRNYSVFGPNLPRTNSVLAATITFDDGSKTVWNSAVTEARSDDERVRQMRFRKFFHDNLLQFRMPHIRKDAAIYIARLHNDGPRKPTSVELVEKWAYIPDPQRGLGKPLPPLTHQRVIYRYCLKSGDLVL